MTPAELEHFKDCEAREWIRRFNQKKLTIGSAKAQGMNLKPPVKKAEAAKSPKSAGRRKSFCGRMCGMKSKLTSAKTAKDPNSRINKSLRAWDCSCR